MQKIKISTVFLGHQKVPVDFQYLTGWKSAIFEFQPAQSIPYSPDANGNRWEYPDSQIEELVTSVTGADVTVVLVSTALERNFYVRRLTGNRIVISLYEMAYILKSANFRLEDFLLRNLYAYSVYFHAYRGRPPTSSAFSWSHHDIRGCLFDMNPQKADVLYSMHQPNLCGDCVQRLGSCQVDASFADALSAELRKIQKPLFFRISDWVKAHPLWSLCLTAGFAVFLNLVASVIFEKAKKLASWLG